MIVVTGSSGFIGSAIAKRLGNQVVALQRSGTAKNGRTLNCDLTDEAQIASVAAELKDVPITHIVHAASITPWSGHVDFREDINMAKSVLYLQERLHQPKLIVLSGWNVYEMNDNPPFSEDTLTIPTSEYGQSKLAVETYVNKNAGPETAIHLRLASVYGEGQMSAGLIPNAVGSAIEQKTIELNGLKTRRDYIHIDDVTMLIEQIIVGGLKCSGPLNVGSGYSHSTSEVAELVVAIMKRDFSLDVSISRPSQPHDALPKDNRLDISLAQRQGLLRHPIRLEDGLKKYISWRLA